ncbi:MAG: A/G-specific adenine glycosylase [Gammaproteobacteria bacterium]|nr:A/G-specific adenine glycosylase [Gammaproteobacteria bacterium]MDE0366007.1 A/G-specific adenine glycosylase [Gammaproteobacteria bacterium]
MDWFARHLLAWFDRHGRKDLPWQRDPTPYRVWVSEIMLQQTRVQTVIPYYERFMARFPDVASLARADLDEVLHLWTGLGYYARGRNLHRAAIQIEQGGSGFPSTREGLEALPGVGRSTAAAVLALAYGKQAAILDGNVKRVLSRFHAVEGDVSRTATLNELWEHAGSHTPERRLGHYAQAIMDLGATVCVRRAPKCDLCPVAGRCKAFANGRAEEFPHRRRSRHKPVRRSRMYVIATHSGAFLLERRRAAGVWGGLWTPPQRSGDCTPMEICRELGIDERSVEQHRTGAVFRHTFSHFHLDIEPVYLVLDKKPGQAAEGERTRWYRPGGTQPVGMPAPAVKLLAGAVDGAAD